MADQDREMLEMAALAAGVFLTRETMAAGWPEFEWRDTDEPTFDGEWMCGTVFWYGGNGELGGSEKLTWNPITDDGDALRLAVKLEIQTGYAEFSGSGFASWDRGTHYLSVYGPEDPYAATRRAIVRAAAEIGRRMKEAGNG